MINVLASIGVPGLNGFIGEALIIIGAFKFKTVFGVLVASGALLGTICMLWMYERVFFGTITKSANSKIGDLKVREIVSLLPLLILMVWIGLFPGYFLNKIAPGAETYTAQFNMNKITTETVVTTEEATEEISEVTDAGGLQ